MDEYEVIGWPEIQYYMEYEGFKENSSLVEPNDNIGIGSSTYLISVEWLKQIEL